MKDRSEVIEELKKFPHLRANFEAAATARVLKRVQKRDLETVTCLQIMVNQSHLGMREKLLHATNLKDGIVG